MSPKCPPQLRKGSQPPSAFASLAVGDVTFRTKSCPPSPEPVWDEGFSFLIRRPHVETLELQVRSGSGPSPGLAVAAPGAAAAPGRAQHGRVGAPARGGGRSCCGHSSGCWCRGTLRRGRPAEPPGGGDPERPRRARGCCSRCGTTASRESSWPSCTAAGTCGRRPGTPPTPYVSLVLLPERSKRKTGVQRRTLNPEFNERFEWELPPDEAPRRRLEATVKSSVNFVTREKEALGKLQLELARVDLSEGDPRWYELQDERSLP
ncbi:extended synaptotagmin-1-like [Ammospiza maritima maritima]